ncbi:hypothetical protein GCM10018952_56380 [Streptosporangium vulgare]
MPASACIALRRPSKLKGRVTTPMVSAPSVRAMLATTGGAAGARAASLTGRDENHVGPLEDLLDLLAVVLGRLAPDFGVGSRAEAAGEFAPDVELDVGVTHQQRLGVGIDGDELDALESLLDHPVDGVDSASADSYNLDDREVVLRCCHDEGPFRSLTCNFMRHGARAVVSKTLTLKLRFSFMST